MVSERVEQKVQMLWKDWDQTAEAPEILKTPEELMTRRMFLRHSWMASSRMSESRAAYSSIKSKICSQSVKNTCDGCPDEGRYHRCRKILEVSVRERSRSSSTVEGWPMREQAKGRNVENSGNKTPEKQSDMCGSFFSTSGNSSAESNARCSRAMA